MEIFLCRVAFFKSLNFSFQTVEAIGLGIFQKRLNSWRICPNCTERHKGNWMSRAMEKDARRRLEQHSSRTKMSNSATRNVAHTHTKKQDPLSLLSHHAGHRIMGLNYRKTDFSRGWETVPGRSKVEPMTKGSGGLSINALKPKMDSHQLRKL